MALIGTTLSLALQKRSRTAAQMAIVTLAISSFLGLVISVLVLGGSEMAVSWTNTEIAGSFLYGLEFVLGPLQALVLLIVSTVALLVSLFRYGALRSERVSFRPTVEAVLVFFYLSMVAVICADNVILFLVAWEAMTLTSYLLVVSGPDGPRSGLSYLTMTHLGTAMIAVAFLLMAQYAGSYRMEDLAGVGVDMPVAVRNATFLLALVGFGVKAGLVPLHFWMPDAYASSPSSVDALLSGGTIGIAIMFMLICFFKFLGAMELWWGLLLMLLASVTALLGALYALEERDLKRLLAFSSVENVGIILLAVGAAMVFYASDLLTLSGLSLVAGLFHLFNHAMFKALLFFGAGAVEDSTGETNMERMGGLAKRMRATSALFLIGAMAVAALPPLNGFVSEWLIFQSLLQSYQIETITVKLVMPIAIGVMALTGALATAGFVRVYGMTFLALPRSQAAEGAKESSPAMVWAMVPLAAICLLSGVLAVYLVPIFDDASSYLIGVDVADQIVNGWSLVPSGEGFSNLSPMVLGVLLLITIPLGFALAIYVGGKQAERREATWDCGTPLSSRNEYTPTAFSQPIVRVFSSIYRSQSEVATEYGASPYVKRRVVFTAHLTPIFERYIVRPVVSTVRGAARRASRIQAGSIQAYLAYIFAILVLLLIIFR